MLTQIEAARPLEMLLSLSSWVVSGKYPVFSEPPRFGRPLVDAEPEHWVDFDALALKRAALAVQIQTELLNKVLPSQKSMDLQAETTVHSKSFTDLELASRVTALLDQQPAAAALPAPTDYSWL